MEIAALKQKIHQQIEDCDETLLKRIASFLENTNSEESDEDSLLIKSLLEKSEIEYRNGEIESKENVLKEARSTFLSK